MSCRWASTTHSLSSLTLTMTFSDSVHSHVPSPRRRRVRTRTVRRWESISSQLEIARSWSSGWMYSRDRTPITSSGVPAEHPRGAIVDARHHRVEVQPDHALPRAQRGQLGRVDLGFLGLGGLAGGDEPEPHAVLCAGVHDHQAHRPFRRVAQVHRRSSRRRASRARSQVLTTVIASVGTMRSTIVARSGGTSTVRNADSGSTWGNGTRNPSCPRATEQPSGVAGEHSGDVVVADPPGVRSRHTRRSADGAMT